MQWKINAWRIFNIIIMNIHSLSLNDKCMQSSQMYPKFLLAVNTSPLAIPS